MHEAAFSGGVGSVTPTPQSDIQEKETGRKGIRGKVLDVSPLAHNVTGVRPLAWGVDAAYTTYDGQLYDRVLLAVDRWTECARANGGPVPTDLVWMGEPMACYASGGRSGWRYHLANSLVDLFLVGHHPNQPVMSVQPKAAAIRELGLDGVIEGQRAELHRWLEEGEFAVERPSRVDLFVDVQGLDWGAFDIGLYRGQDGLTRFGVRNVVTRAGSIDPGRGADARPVGDRRRGQSLYFGRRGQPIHLRVYDKTAESNLTLESPHPLASVWSGNGWDGSRVLRFEFELKRTGLREWVQLGQDGETSARVSDVGDWDDLRPMLQSVWRYLVLEWWRFRKPQTGRHAGRGRVEWWDKLSELEVAKGHQVPAARVAQRRGMVQQLQRQVAGLVATIAALEGITDAEQAFNEVAAAVSELYETRPFDERVRAAQQRSMVRLPVEWWLWQQRRSLAQAGEC